MSGIVGLIAAPIETGRRRARTRAASRGLDDRLLDDVGRAIARREAAKRPWQA